MAQCENCGANLKPGMKRCLKCGAVLAESVPTAPTGPVGQDSPTGQPPREWHDIRNLHVNVNINPADLAGYRPQQPSASAPAPNAGTQPLPGPVMSPDGAPAYPGGTVVLKPHRGWTILILAVLAAGVTFFMMGVDRPSPAVWFIPFFPAMIAWRMGVKDIREMKAGRRDPGGKGVAGFGKVLAFINLLLLLYLIVGGFIKGQ